MKITWDGEPKPEHEALIRSEVERLMEQHGLPRPEDLIFHHISLSRRENGPSITVLGCDEGDGGGVIAIYNDETKWVSISGE